MEWEDEAERGYGCHAEWWPHEEALTSPILPEMFGLLAQETGPMRLDDQCAMSDNDEDEWHQIGSNDGTWMMSMPTNPTYSLGISESLLLQQNP